MRLYRSKIAQVDGEIDGFIKLLAAEEVLSYLEIGSQYGGSLWKVASSLPKGSRIVSVDKPTGETAPHLKQAIDDLKAAGYDARLFLADSTVPETVKQVRALGPFDAIFIDGNHTLPYVTSDWQNYGQMSPLVAFHDIAWDRPARPGRLPIEVSMLWNQIRGFYKHLEIVAPGSEKGIGVLWH